MCPVGYGMNQGQGQGQGPSFNSSNKPISVCIVVRAYIPEKKTSDWPNFSEVFEISVSYTHKIFIEYNTKHYKNVNQR